MTLKPVTYYEIVCNEAGCRARTNYDYSAWSDEETALEDAEEAGWGMDNDGNHWCPDHYPTCPPGQHLREDEDDRCKRCKRWPDDGGPMQEDDS